MSSPKVKNRAGRKRLTPIDQHVGSRVRMRRLMLDMSQSSLADELGLTFQQVQKYEKGVNRVGSGRLQIIADILQVPITFFFEGAPGRRKLDSEAPSPSFVTELVTTVDGLRLTKAFVQVKETRLRRIIVEMVEQIARHRNRPRRA